MLNNLVRSASLLAIVAAATAAESPVFLDMNRSWDERTADYVSRLTVQQKADLLDHRGPRVKVAGSELPSDHWNQCLNGVKWSSPETQWILKTSVRSADGDPVVVARATTLFPICIGMGATWNPGLIQEVAGAISDEARAINNGWRNDPDFTRERKGLIYRAPVINICRNPYWGRIYEIFSEDTFLTGRMAVAYVKGLQGDDPRYLKIAATLKHYAVNNVETDRTKLNAVVSERMLREYWLPHFRDAVVEGHAQSLMASYNAINGVPSNINHWLLTDVLKNEWQHEGFVVSDLGGVTTMVEGHEAKQMAYVDAVAKSVAAGCDFSDNEYRENIAKAVAAGKLTLARLDDAVRRVIKVRMRLGEFDPPAALPWAALRPSDIGGPRQRALSLKAAQESMVLLQNQGALLPLSTGVKKLAVIGPHADRMTMNDYNGTAKDCITALAGLRNRLGPAVEIRYVEGCQLAHDRYDIKVLPPQPQIDLEVARAEAVAAARSAEVAIVFVGTNGSIEREETDRTSLGLPADQQALVEAVYAANPKTVVVLMNAGPMTVPWIKAHIPAVVEAWWPGEEGGHAIADVLLGRVNPAGRLPYTIYASEAQVPPLTEYDISRGFTYQYVRGEPLYPFGHGLSYTTFAYRGLTLSAAAARDGDTLTATVTLANIGARDGDEVVQIYVTEPAGQVVKPRQRLAGFARVGLKAGEQRTVQIPIEVARLRYWDEARHAFVAEPGSYTVYTGGSSAQHLLQGSFTVAP